MTRDAIGPGGTSRRAFLGLGALGALAAASGCSGSGSGSAPAARAASSAPARDGRSPRTRCPAIRAGRSASLGAANAIMGYTGAASVLTGQSFPLFVSTTVSGASG